MAGQAAPPADGPVQNDAPVTVSSSKAQQLAEHELQKPQYHFQNQPHASLSPSPSPTPSSPTPSPPPQHSSSHKDVGTIVAVVLAIVLLLVLAVMILRRLTRKRDEDESDEKRKKKRRGGGPDGPGEEILTGSARMRRDAEAAARSGDWETAIRERFHAVVTLLDERGLLPERPERTADEAAFDAGLVLPAHAQVLSAAARAFDDVEYGEYQGTAEGYELISRVDDAVLNAGPGDEGGVAEPDTALSMTAAAGSSDTDRADTGSARRGDAGGERP
jgi:hypothetical protein